MFSKPSHGNLRLQPTVSTCYSCESRQEFKYFTMKLDKKKEIEIKSFGKYDWKQRSLVFQINKNIYVLTIVQAVLMYLIECIAFLVTNPWDWVKSWQIGFYLKSSVNLSPYKLAKGRSKASSPVDVWRRAPIEEIARLVILWKNQ